VCAIGAADVLAAVGRLGKPVNVVSLNPHSLGDIKNDIRSVAKAADKPERADRVIANLEAKTKAVRRLTENSEKPRVFCVEWLKPLMNAGHWVPEMVEYAGGFDGLAERWRASTYIDWGVVTNYDPEVIVLMPCGFTTNKTVEQAAYFLEQPEARRLTAVRNGSVYATDGHSYFSRSGPRLFDGIRILAQIIHPELFDKPPSPELAKQLQLMQA
jgi:iron complex transport system substrate-binding protein